MMMYSTVNITILDIAIILLFKTRHFVDWMEIESSVQNIVFLNKSQDDE
jgi:hypothetical protein